MSTAAAKFLRQMGSVESGLLTQAGILLQTTIATLASQTSFTLTAGSPDNSAYVDCTVIVTDATTPAQKAVGRISAYTGATKTVTLGADPAIYTMAVGDAVVIVPKTAALDVIDTIVDAILVDTSTTLDDLIDTEIASLMAGRPQVSTANITQAADDATVGGVVKLTVAGAPIWVTGVTLIANAAAHANLTAIAIQKGNDLNSPIWIDSTLGAAANLNVTGEQVSAPGTTVPCRLEVGATINALSTGTGPGACNHTLAVAWWGEGATSALA